MGKHRLLLTGAAGFVGHHFLEYVLYNTDWEVVTLDNLNYAGDLNRIQYVLSLDPSYPKRVTHVYHDLKAPLVESVVKRISDVNYIVHMAASSHVTRSITDPMEFVMSNVVGTVNLLEYAKYLPVTFLYFSTDEIFGPGIEGYAFKEYDRYNSKNPYAATKAAAEEMCISYHNTYDLPMLITHSSNIFGLRQHPEKFIPSTIKKIADEKTITIHASGGKSSSRKYVSVNDVSDALWFLLAERETYQKKIVVPPAFTVPKFNITCHSSTSNFDLAQMIAKAQNKTLNYQFIEHPTDRPGFDPHYELSGEYMTSLGWGAVEHIDDKIEKLVKWSLKHPEWLN
jgi:dTDP-glucose 4,6-dehydratase